MVCCPQEQAAEGHRLSALPFLHYRPWAIHTYPSIFSSPQRIPQRKPWGSMASSLTQALAAVSEHRPQLLDDVPPARTQEGTVLLDVLLKWAGRVPPLGLAL